MKYLKTISSLGILLFIIYLSYDIVQFSLKNQRYQSDYAEINDIKYGLFSINQWKKKLSKIITTEISKFDVSTGEKDQIKPLIEKQLSKLIDNVYEEVAKKNKKSFKGKIKQAFIDTLVDLDDIKKGVPGYADDVIKILEKRATKTEIKGLLLERVEDYFKKTYEKQDTSRLEEIRKEFSADNLNSAKTIIDQKINKISSSVYKRTWTVIVLSILIFLIAFFYRRSLRTADYLILVGTLLALLFSGVTTPMINLEAKISEMSFVLFDQPLSFINQVLYFQSKSVIDVFWIMITHEDLQMKAVGILMISFSILFPLLKLSSSVFYFCDFKNFRKSRIIRFFVLKSGKWSMADVLIIAIFMSYIGLNGVIATQFGKLHSADSEIVLLTTNGTSLQPGFYLFLSYAILALFLTEFLPHEEK